MSAALAGRQPEVRPGAPRARRHQPHPQRVQPRAPRHGRRRRRCDGRGARIAALQIFLHPRLGRATQPGKSTGSSIPHARDCAGSHARFRIFIRHHNILRSARCVPEADIEFRTSFGARFLHQSVYQLPGIIQRVKKRLRALFHPRFSGRIWRYRSVLALFSSSLGEPIGLTTTFSTG
jgi:hypothetical protein